MGQSKQLPLLSLYSIEFSPSNFSTETRVYRQPFEQIRMQLSRQWWHHRLSMLGTIHSPVQCCAQAAACEGCCLRRLTGQMCVEARLGEARMAGWLFVQPLGDHTDVTMEQSTLAFPSFRPCCVLLDVARKQNEMVHYIT